MTSRIQFLIATAALAFGVLAFRVPPAPAATAGEDEDLRKMAQQHQHDKPVASPAAMAEPAQPVSAQEVTYGEVAGKPLRGYLAHPKAAAKQPLPAILVIHEWWGLNDNIRAMTRRLAGEGYTALAIDLYNGQVADNPDAAMKLMAAASKDKPAAEENLRHAHDYLKKAGAPRVGVIGWCFGGGWSLQAALLIPNISTAVMYYGRPETDKEKLARLQAPLLGLFGADDQSIPVAAVHELEGTLKELGKQVEFHIYDGAGHAFANPSGTNYRPEAARDAWNRTVAFFKAHL